MTRNAKSNPNKEPAKRQRAKSMFVEPNVQPNNVCKDIDQFTLDEMHFEFSARYASPNRGLKPSTSRQLPEPQSKPVFEWEKLGCELTTKLSTRKAKEQT